ncbi:hypothetical protein M5K25_016939 [Dendrobium thyrsiflorum]|uniref:Uncharacterized protein n=1 Tax=Dendrobium thyrsiflorum TaxID=117978 RepID=A0ABD0ULT9_DENTH
MGSGDRPGMGMGVRVGGKLWGAAHAGGVETAPTGTRAAHPASPARHGGRIERLDEKNPTNLRSLNSDIIKASKCPSSSPCSRGSISTVHLNHSKNTFDLSLIY